MSSDDKGPIPPAPYPRIVRSGRGARRFAPILQGRGGGRWTDIYQGFLSAPWWAFLAGMAVIYVVFNAAFAELYLLDPGGIAGARPRSFWDAFFFSVQTLGTLGYGVMAPRSFYANVVVTVEVFLGILNIAVVAGIMFARVSRPTARVMFSRLAVVTPFDGVPTLMFRVANQRGNQILEATVSLTLARQVTTREGYVMRRFEELALVRARTPLFVLSWTVMHPIDQASPLYDATRESLLADQVELIVVLSGTDETYSDTIYARHSFLPHEIHWNRRFADFISVQPDGRPLVDLGKLHALEELDVPEHDLPQG
jgi:inward rectifier potassium channel